MAQKKVIVQTKTGTVEGPWQSDGAEADGWDHLMTTTLEGEGFRDVGVAILVVTHGVIYIPTDQIVAVEIREFS